MVIRVNGLVTIITLFLMFNASIVCVQKACSESRRRALLSVPVADLWSAPSKKVSNVMAPVIATKDVSGLKTQILLGEPLMVLQERGDWIEVQALEQTDEGKPCSGWLLKNQVVLVADYPTYNLVACNHNVALYKQPNKKSMVLMTVSIGTKFAGEKLDDMWWAVLLPDGRSGVVLADDIHYCDDQLDEQLMRNQLVATAYKMVGTPFCWFCRSSWDKNSHDQLTGMGCDGLTNLMYRVNGLEIPRFAADQYAQGTPLDGCDAKPGDLIFFASAKREYRAHHAMMYLGDDKLIEATFQSGPPHYPARIISCHQRLKKSIQTIKNGEGYGTYRVYFCSYLFSMRKMRVLRSCARQIAT